MEDEIMRWKFSDAPTLCKFSDKHLVNKILLHALKYTTDDQLIKIFDHFDGMNDINEFQKLCLENYKLILSHTSRIFMFIPHDALDEIVFSATEFTTEQLEYLTLIYTHRDTAMLTYLAKNFPANFFTTDIDDIIDLIYVDDELIQNAISAGVDKNVINKLELC